MKTALEHVAIKDGDILYKDMDLDGWVLLEKNSLDQMLRDNRNLKTRVKKLENELYKSRTQSFNLKKAFQKCFYCCK